MSDTVKPVRAKLWREGLRLFRGHWGEWVKWAVWFFVITALFQAMLVVQMTDPVFMGLAQKVLEAKNAKEPVPPELTAEFLRSFLGAMVWMIPLVFVNVVQSFTYKVFFMQQQPGIGSPKLGVGRFFYMIWVDIQIGVIIWLAMAVLIAVPAVAGFKFAHISPFVVPAAVIVGLIGLGVVVFLSFRFALAPILAVCAAKPVIKNSWQLMKGNCWRLFGNSILLLLVVLLFGIVVMLVEMGMGMALCAGGHALFAQIAPNLPLSTQSFFPRYFMPTVGSVDQQIKQFIHIVFDSMNMCVLVGVIWAYHCAAIRVFYEEKRAADPAFSLVASS